MIAKLTFIQFRSSHPEVLYGKNILKTFAKFTRKHMCRSLRELPASRIHIKKKTPAQVFSYKFSKAFKNNFSVEQLIRAVSVNSLFS